MVSSFVTAILMFAAFCLACVLFRGFIKKRPVARLTLLYAACLPLLYLFFPYVESAHLDSALSPQAQTILMSVVLLLFLYAAYMQVYGLIDFSISFRVLYHFLEKPTHALTPEELHEVYPFDEVVERKIGRAVEWGLIKEKEIGRRKVLLNSAIWNFVGRRSSALLRFMDWGKGG